MAEGFVNHVLGDAFRAYSAGVAPAEEVHPLAIRAMAELGIDISHHRPKTPDALKSIVFDLVITVCDDAAAHCPLWLREGRVEHIGFEDPAQAPGSEAERLQVFRRVRDDIQERVLAFLRQFLQETSQVP